jgi:Cu-Zn family superoxide dismutase
MKTQALLTAAALALAVPALAQSPKATKPPETKPQETKAADTAKATLQDAKGQPMGDVTLEQTPHGVLIRGTLSNLPAGVHAIHIHEAGKCEAPEFKTAGGHFNPHKKAHGMLNPQGKHEGDLPNLTVGQDGKVQFEFFANQGLTVKSLQDTDGAAVVVHAKADDYKTDPAGDAGGRIACGVVSK